MKKFLTKFAKGESGATAIEYALIAGLISVVAITALTTLGGNLDSTFTTISDSLSADDSST
ncbi:Flp family type IVb pilin [Thalassovita mediterranea]|jgi:pilus assembly protein Flp/PilA|uniref:Flp pilus assembly protein, pilin Flp n=1 Tax=Thalassovita mediterranea TaxID=340021 RepID=A0A0P1GQY2_9RHOB|nr:Flp family type IVb pilin [Thalassovita mediterranea]MCG7574445.1 Flp family type IVb pilin [Phaeobacter sp. CNT1-3]CUH84910.1 Flp pilus assembly protein, pilin Flp [Thalassovita mediterranea]SIS29062.1 pilus assembly protein Flp/PilA [Thalassovita mediterranea]